jgi:WD40 repeat protein
MSIIKDNENNTLLNNNNNNIITSLSWMNNGICLGVGLPNGIIELWDIIKGKRIREIEAHKERISSLVWNNYILSSGSKDKLIKNFDVRSQDVEISKIHQHKQEVCALKYSPEGDLLSSGGNDNVCYIWDVRKLNNKLLNISNLNDVNNNDINSIKPLLVNNHHTAAVKAMAWCPWQRHILATGGGTKDKTIKILNCDTNKIIKNVETGSQVCSLLWNKKERELISSHGYNKNQITIWNYQKMKKECELKGHMSRVLYLTMSPDENFICSGSGDETLRFWKINDEIKEVQNEEDPLLSNVLIR